MDCPPLPFQSALKGETGRPVTDAASQRELVTRDYPVALVSSNSMTVFTLDFKNML
jgi:hypothetical protein